MWNPFSWGSTFDYLFKGAKATGRGIGGLARKATGYNYTPMGDLKFQKVDPFKNMGARAPYRGGPSGTGSLKQHTFMGYHSQFIKDKMSTAQTTYRGMKAGPKGFGGLLTGTMGAGMGAATMGATAFNFLTPGLDPLTMFSVSQGMQTRANSYQDNPQDHSSRLHAALGAISQEGLDTFLMMGVSTLGPAGAMLGLLTSSVGDMSGVGANQILERSLGKIADQLESDQYGKRRVSQNERTARATSDQMSLILQSGYAGNELINPQSFSARRRGLLGNEAMLMHN